MTRWEQYEKQMIKLALLNNVGSPTYAAKWLGLCVKTIKNKINKYDLSEYCSSKSKEHREKHSERRDFLEMYEGLWDRYK